MSLLCISSYTHLYKNHTHSQDPIEEFPGSVSTAIGVHGTAYGSRMLFIHLLSSRSERNGGSQVWTGDAND